MSDNPFTTKLSIRCCGLLRQLRSLNPAYCLSIKLTTLSICITSRFWNRTNVWCLPWPYTEGQSLKDETLSRLWLETLLRCMDLCLPQKVGPVLKNLQIMRDTYLWYMLRRGLCLRSMISMIMDLLISTGLDLRLNSSKARKRCYSMLSTSTKLLE